MAAILAGDVEAEGPGRNTARADREDDGRDGGPLGGRDEGHGRSVAAPADTQGQTAPSGSGLFGRHVT